LASFGAAKLATALRGNLTTTAIVGLLLVPLFVFAEDFRVAHLIHINDPPYRFRTAYSQELSTHYYPRKDYRSAAEYVNQHAGSSDSVIAFDLPLPHYLKRTSAIFIQANTGVHSNVAACNGQRERWSNVPLIDSPKQLFEYISRSNQPVWLILRFGSREVSRPFESELAKRFQSNRQFTTADGQLAVYRLVPPTENSDSRT
jgi:hypothetical protein